MQYPLLSQGSEYAVMRYSGSDNVTGTLEVINGEGSLAQPAFKIDICSSTAGARLFYEWHVAVLSAHSSYGCVIQHLMCC